MNNDPHCNVQYADKGLSKGNVKIKPLRKFSSLFMKLDYVFPKKLPIA